MEITFHCQASLGNQITIRNLVQRYQLNSKISKTHQLITLKGDKTMVNKLKADRGWNQFVKFNHIKDIKEN